MQTASVISEEPRSSDRPCRQPSSCQGRQVDASSASELTNRLPLENWTGKPIVLFFRGLSGETRVELPTVGAVSHDMPLVYERIPCEEIPLSVNREMSLPIYKGHRVEGLLGQREGARDLPEPRNGVYLIVPKWVAELAQRQGWTRRDLLITGKVRRNRTTHEAEGIESLTRISGGGVASGDALGREEGP